MTNLKTVIVGIVATIALFAGISAQAQQEERNKIRLSYGDGITPTVAFNIMGVFIDHDYNAPGTFSLAYRHLLDGDRWAIGGDLTYMPIIEKSKEGKESNLSIFLIMPGIDFNYIKSGIVRLYGTASAGIGVGSDVGFAFQVNPLAIRVGNNKIAGFAEAGIGCKSIFNIGIEFGF